MNCARLNIVRAECSVPEIRSCYLFPQSEDAHRHLNLRTPIGILMLGKRGNAAESITSRKVVNLLKSLDILHSGNYIFQTFEQLIIPILHSEIAIWTQL